MRASWFRCSTGSLLLIGALAACSGPDREPAVPENLTEQAMVLGIADARLWADTQAQAIADEITQAQARERVAVAKSAPVNVRLAAAHYLAVSGGTDRGAFGAGLLAGWSETGTRPEFKLVTGISTGALIAPFAFLGSKYDDKLRAIYIVNSGDIYQRRWFLPAIFDDALASSEPLSRLISQYIDADLLAAIAREYDKGRLLLIGTTNLDVQRPVIWNIGAIARSGNPGALDLVRKVMLASVSVPGMFPPVLIDVEAASHRYQEMHVDGGAVTKTFLVPPHIGSLVDLNAERLARDRHAYIIFNARLEPEWSSVRRQTLTISARAISTLIHYAGYSDVLRIYATAQRNGIDYNLAYIDDDFKLERKSLFDPTYMKALFDYRYAQGRRGNAWHKAPPILGGPDAAN